MINLYLKNLDDFLLVKHIAFDLNEEGVLYGKAAHAFLISVHLKVTLLVTYLIRLTLNKL